MLDVGLRPMNILNRRNPRLPSFKHGCSQIAKIRQHIEDSLPIYCAFSWQEMVVILPAVVVQMEMGKADSLISGVDSD